MNALKIKNLMFNQVSDKLKNVILVVSCEDFMTRLQEHEKKKRAKKKRT